jgi:hypothetical protein
MLPLTAAVGGAGMGVLDDPVVRPLANYVLGSIDQAEDEANVVFSPIAREIAALFIIGSAFETPGVSEAELAPNTTGALVSEYVSRQVSGLAQDARDMYSVSTRSQFRGVITSADVFHYLADRGRILATSILPYPKDRDGG